MIRPSPPDFPSPLLHQISTGDSLHWPQLRSATFHRKDFPSPLVHQISTFHRFPFSSPPSNFHRFTDFPSPLLHQISIGDSLHRPQPRSATFHCNSPLPFSLHRRTRFARIRRPPAAQDHGHACVVEPFYTALE
ncbi:uncharacterized protein LOC131016731 isoform X2 [Salvia miltiorrhiza]|nr:uncharacterized protein LOC131016731 isoform X2 [Salvia miltiorrhiza]